MYIHTYTFFAKHAGSAAAAVIGCTVRECNKRAGSPSKDAEERERDDGEGGTETRGPACVVDAQNCAASKIH